MEIEPGPSLGGEIDLEAVDVYIGQVLAERYRLVRRLGRGGMGAVYEAEHLLIGRRVAVKLLFAQHAGDPSVVRRFMNEARASAQLDHPNILESTDMGRAPDGSPFIVYELLEGRDLEHEIHAVGPLPVPRVVHIALQVAAALDAAHARGIIHRDLKPANVFLVQKPGVRDHVKVLDFGISKFLLQARGPYHTATGFVLGTPQYMPPECLRGESAIDARADVYALGVLLYQMLTHALPFEADTLPRLFQLIHEQPPVPLSSLRSDVPAGLVRVIEQALAKTPANRPATMEEFAEAIRPFGVVTGQTVATTIPPPALTGTLPAAPRTRIVPGHDAVSGPFSSLVPAVTDGRSIVAARPRRRLVHALEAAAVLGIAGVVLAWRLIAVAPVPEPSRQRAAIVSGAVANKVLLVPIPVPAPRRAIPDAAVRSVDREPAPAAANAPPPLPRAASVATAPAARTRPRTAPAAPATPRRHRTASGATPFVDHPDF